MMSSGEPSLGELGRLLQALRDDFREDMAAINLRLDKLVSADVYAVEKAAMIKDIADLARALEQLSAKHDQDIRTINDQRTQDVLRVTQTRRWIVASVVIPMLGLIVPVVLFLASGGKP